MASSMEDLFREHATNDRQDFKALNERLDSLDKKVDDLAGLLRQYKGFFGGIVFAVTSIVGAVALVVHWIRS